MRRIALENKKSETTTQEEAYETNPIRGFHRRWFAILIITLTNMFSAWRAR